MVDARMEALQREAAGAVQPVALQPPPAVAGSPPVRSDAAGPTSGSGCTARESRCDDTGQNDEPRADVAITRDASFIITTAFRLHRNI